MLGPQRGLVCHMTDHKTKSTDVYTIQIFILFQPLPPPPTVNKISRNSAPHPPPHVYSDPFVYYAPKSNQFNSSTMP